MAVKDFRQGQGLNFVTAFGVPSRSPRQAWTLIIIGISAVNVLLGSLDGEASEVLMGLGVLGIGLLLRSKFLIKRRSRLYENDPHLGQNDR